MNPIMTVNYDHVSEFSKTISEFDIYSFAGITGDFSPNHVNLRIMAKTEYGERIAHGVLILGLGSTVASQYLRENNLSAVSYGYDRLRFVRPVKIGDTISMQYRITATDTKKNRATAALTGINQLGETVLVAEHILQFM